MGFSDEDIAAFKEVFAYYMPDKEKEEIPSFELGTVMRNLGKCPLESELDAMQNEHGKENMSFDTFLTFMEKPLKDTVMPGERELLDCFAVFDDEGKGKIEKNEFRKIMREIGEGLSAKEFELITTDADAEADGMVDYKKIVEVMFAKSKKEE